MINVKSHVATLRTVRVNAPHTQVIITSVTSNYKEEALISLNTSLSIYMLDVEATETVMKGQASEISHICEFSWYQWVMFCDGPVQHPADNLVLGCYLGPAQDVGPAMTAKTLKANGEVVP